MTLMVFPILLTALISSLFVYYFSNSIIVQNSLNDDETIVADSRSEYSELKVTPEKIHCNATVPLPVWSRGIARTCCDFFPEVIASDRVSYFEHGHRRDPKYIFMNSILKKSGVFTVYIAIPDFSFFLDEFIHLSDRARVILVTGSEDIGAPYEIFHPHRRDDQGFSMEALWPHGQQMTLIEFLNDSRLAKWFVQNYDLIGCNPFSCSSFQLNQHHDDYLSKVIPIPIGLDLHTAAEKQNPYPVKSLSSYRQHHLFRRPDFGYSLRKEFTLLSLCRQRLDMESAIRDGVSVVRDFSSRHLSILVSFSCELRTSAHKKNRKNVCKIIAEARRNKLKLFSYPIDAKRMPEESDRYRFWFTMSRTIFALAPSGHGIDTHRFWEILCMGGIPIVKTSSLDALYSQFPCVILKSWSELKAANFLHRMREEILIKFGNEPFSTNLREKLTLSYWVSKIQDEKERVVQLYRAA